MSTETVRKNEAAERLRASLKFGDAPWPDLDEALAAERCATVERIRERLTKEARGFERRTRLVRILDEEA